jgi:hypothetical protein
LEVQEVWTMHIWTLQRKTEIQLKLAVANLRVAAVAAVAAAAAAA